MSAEESAPKPRSTRRRVLRWTVEGLAGLGLFIGLSRFQTRGLIDSGSVAPDFEVQGLDGKRVALGDFHGQRVLLHFWATWCGVCRQEFGMLNRLHAELPQGARLLALAAEEDVEALRRFVAEHDLQYAIAIADRDVLQRYRVQAFPTNYFLDGEGRVNTVTVGMSTGFALRARLQ